MTKGSSVFFIQKPILIQKICFIKLVIGNKFLLRGGFSRKAISVLFLEVQISSIWKNGSKKSCIVGSLFLKLKQINICWSFHRCICIFLCSQEAEAILEDIRPSPWQLLGFGTVSVNFVIFTTSQLFVIFVGFSLCLLLS